MTQDQSIKDAHRKVSNVLSRGHLKLIRKNGGAPTLQISGYSKETIDDIEMPQSYGLASTPMPGAEVVVGFFGGNRDHGTVLKVHDKRYRPQNLAGGDVCLYNAAGTKILLSGSQLTITTTQAVTITAPTLTINSTTAVNITSPMTTINGDLTVSGVIHGTVV